MNHYRWYMQDALFALVNNYPELMDYSLFRALEIWMQATLFVE